MAKKSGGRKRTKKASSEDEAEEPEPAIEVTVREDNAPPERATYLVIWWHLQKIYCGLFETESEARLQAMSRNGVIIEVRGRGVSVEQIVDFWRRDDDGNPLPAEWLTARYVSA